MIRDHKRTIIRPAKQVNQSVIGGFKVQGVETNLCQNFDHQHAKYWVILNNDCPS
jgi:hypothetical protein